MNYEKSWKYNPVSIVVALVLVAVFVMYRTSNVSVPCENNLLTNASRDFIHIDPYHLIVNLMGLYYVASLERRVGSYKYASLIAILVALSSIFTYTSEKLFNLNCSIGFSGVLLGLMTYGLLSRREKIDWKPVLYLVAISITPTAPNVSVSGHLIGIVAGITAFFGTQLIFLEGTTPVQLFDDKGQVRQEGKAWFAYNKDPNQFLVEMSKESTEWISINDTYQQLVGSKLALVLFAVICTNHFGSYKLICGVFN